MINKKCAFFETIVMTILIVMFIVGAVFGKIIYDDFLSDGDIGSSGLAVSAKFYDVFNAFDALPIIMLIVLFIIGLVTLSTIQSNPLFLLLGILMLVVVIIFTNDFSNFALDMGHYSDAYNDSLNTFTSSKATLTNLPLIIFVMGCVFLVVLYAKAF
jgi:ABC-type uncharacterized transport system fused permease/ATPase subunit